MIEFCVPYGTLLYMLSLITVLYMLSLITQLFMQLLIINSN